MLNTQKTDLQATCLLSLNGSSVQHQYTYIPFMYYKYLFLFSNLYSLYKSFFSCMNRKTTGKNVIFKHQSFFLSWFTNFRIEKKKFVIYRIKETKQVYIYIYIYMSHFAYACKMRYPLNLVLENIEYR